MKRNSLSNTAISLLIAGAAVIALTVAAVAMASSTEDQRSSSAADQVRMAERTFLKAAVAADTATAGQLLAPDFQLIDVLGESETRGGYLANLRGVIDFVTLRPVSPIKVRVDGDTAVARFQATFVVVAGPDRLKHRGWFTDVLERRDGRWQLIWSQTTPVPNDPALLVRALKAHP
jgi:hypothetical protein